MIEKIIITSLYINGIFAVTSPGMIFERIHIYADQLRLPDWIKKPLFDCSVCMSSIHGLYMGFVFNIELIMLPVFILAVCGLNYVIILKTS